MQKKSGLLIFYFSVDISQNLRRNLHISQFPRRIPLRTCDCVVCAQSSDARAPLSFWHAWLRLFVVGVSFRFFRLRVSLRTYYVEATYRMTSFLSLSYVFLLYVDVQDVYARFERSSRSNDGRRRAPHLSCRAVCVAPQVVGS